ncbi:hypothetical protein RJT34_14332 [Clitoria ternatea]|uniref:Hydrophobic seed protein domain-containing protein n=1 Tax=Clitoria ternatea TaxID=43366 RepID=A0AAN9PMC6_CLITE
MGLQSVACSAVLLFLHLLLFSMVATGNILMMEGQKCPNVQVCLEMLDIVKGANIVPTQAQRKPCCSTIADLPDAEAAACLCQAMSLADGLMGRRCVALGFILHTCGRHARNYHCH